MSKVIVYKAHGNTLEVWPVEAETLDEATLQTAHGVYTVLRTYPGHRVVRFSRHLERLRLSAEMLGERYALGDNWIRRSLRRAIEQTGFDLVRARLTIPFGEPETLLVAVEPFTPPPESLYREGVKVALVEGKRESPLAKNSRFIEWRKQVQSHLPPGTYEMMLQEAGLISEGAGSNFYAVFNGRLQTAQEGMLEGIARGILLDVAASILPVDLARIRVDDLPAASEAMLTSASRGVIPVVQVDQVQINGGRPGPVAGRLRRAYDAQVEAELEAI